jgi:hypothetical protein
MYVVKATLFTILTDSGNWTSRRVRLLFLWLLLLLFLWLLLLLLMPFDCVCVEVWLSFEVLLKPFPLFALLDSRVSDKLLCTML